MILDVTSMTSFIREAKMHVWPVQEAKAKLTQFIHEAENSPQIISRRGEPKIVAMSIEQYNKLTKPKKHQSIVSFFRNSPLYGVDLDIERDKSPMRKIDL